MRPYSQWVSDKTYRVKEVARLARVTVRTLHHYDSIGLLVPSGRTDSGYRLYSEDDLLRLQQILLGRELGLSLEQIRRTLDDPSVDREAMLLVHRDQLVKRFYDVAAMIRSVDQALETMKGGTDMEPEGLFEGFDPTEHQEEVRERWGDTNTYREAARRTKGYSREDWARIKSENKALMEALAAKLREGASTEDEEVVALAEKHRLHLDRWYYPCTHRMHAGLGEMYLSDERFTKTLARYGEGLAAFLAAAIRANAARAGSGNDG